MSRHGGVLERARTSFRNDVKEAREVRFEQERVRSAGAGLGEPPGRDRLSVTVTVTRFARVGI